MTNRTAAEVLEGLVGHIARADAASRLRPAELSAIVTAIQRLREEHAM
jgi:hypothetical protein